MNLTSWLFSIGGLLAIAGTVRWYISWLRGVETLPERQKMLREEIVDKRFNEESDIYLVDQINYIEEGDSLGYRIRKHIPLISDLRGSTTLTISSVGSPSRPYVWSKDDVGEDFNTYLQEIAQDRFPEVQIIYPEFNSDSFTEVPEVRMRIHSLNPTALAKTLEKIPTFHSYYFENYPGDARFNNTG